jgi:hypothetical protein
MKKLIVAVPSCQDKVLMLQIEISKGMSRKVINEFTILQLNAN